MWICIKSFTVVTLRPVVAMMGSYVVKWHATQTHHTSTQRRGFNLYLTWNFPPEHVSIIYADSLIAMSSSADVHAIEFLLRLISPISMSVIKIAHETSAQEVNTQKEKQKLLWIQNDFKRCRPFTILRNNNNNNNCPSSISFWYPKRTETQILI